MKKLLLVLAIGAFAACNSSSTEKAADAIDSVKTEATKAADSLVQKADSTVGAVVDSAKAKIDSLKK